MSWRRTVGSHARKTRHCSCVWVLRSTVRHCRRPPSCLNWCLNFAQGTFAFILGQAHGKSMSVDAFPSASPLQIWHVCRGAAVNQYWNFDMLQMQRISTRPSSTSVVDTTAVASPSSPCILDESRCCDCLFVLLTGSLAQCALTCRSIGTCTFRIELLSFFLAFCFSDV